MLKSKYAPIIIYLSVVIIYITSLKNLSRISKHSTKKELITHDVIKILATFRPYYFTIWNFVLQLIFLLIAVVDETLKLLYLPLTAQKYTNKTRTFLFNALILPSTLLVVTVFWSLWHIDRELIYPKVVDEVIPNWLNHILHTFIVVPIIIEICLPKKYNNLIEFKNAVVVLVIYGALYLFLYTSIYLRYGVWLYPICYILNWMQMLVLASVVVGMALVYQKIGIILQNLKISEEGVKIQ